MLFTSLVFIFIFLPVLLLLYYALPQKLKNYSLLIFSLLFYAWGGVSYTLILILSILFNYLFVSQISRKKPNEKSWLIIGLVFNVTIIFIFKYLDFFILNYNGIGSSLFENFSGLPKANIVLPLGISFFTFQQMSLLWDVYRSDEVKRLNFMNTALYISFFPQLIAGPIVRYNDIIHQIRSRKETISLFNSGVQRFIIGLFKKIIFANSCAAIADSIMDNATYNITTPMAWLGIIAYAFQIYFDFSGYSDMAIGLGRMFGFRILENFNFPYISRSIKEFWRRWHISLSTWFRDYVYIPIGGNRKGRYKTYFNLVLVFLLTGFWHGATWSFVFWGIFHGSFLIIERLGLGKILDRIPRFISWSYAILVVLVGWVFFRIERISDAFNFVGRMFGGGEANEISLYNYLDIERVIILLLCVLASSPLVNKLKNLILEKASGRLDRMYQISKGIMIILMLVYSVLYINSGSYNPFIYFRF